MQRQDGQVSSHSPTQKVQMDCLQSLNISTPARSSAIQKLRGEKKRRGICGKVHIYYPDTGQLSSKYLIFSQFRKKKKLLKMLQSYLLPL